MCNGEQKRWDQSEILKETSHKWYRIFPGTQKEFVGFRKDLGHEKCHHS